MTKIRTRIAPSPTGDPHLGTAYIALFNYAFAKAHGGQFILRIEDTDRARSSIESEKMILDALRWIGLSWDEGPDTGGSSGPYRQSERNNLYQKYCQQLIKAGHAFRCFCTPDELELMRQQQMAAGLTPKYDGRHAFLSDDEIQARLLRKEPYVIRMRIPAEGECRVNDGLRGEIVIQWSQVDMQVLMKADGSPTYHLANVIDDHLMKISHVIRGEEWIPSAPKHQLLYSYFGWDMPELYHLPLLRNPDHSKLSKRKNPTSILFYRAQGYLPQAVLNYLGRMGWSMPDEREQFSLQEMIDVFDIDRVSLGDPTFDVEKLSWLNGIWIKDVLSDDELLEKLLSWMIPEDFMRQLIPHLRTRIQVFSDAGEWIIPLWQNKVILTTQMLDGIGLDPDQSTKCLHYLIWQMESIQHWNRDNVFKSVQFVSNALDLNMKEIMPLVFLALAGSKKAISAFDLAVILGADRTRARLRSVLDAFGSPSKKSLKKLQKSYQNALAEIDNM